MRIYRLMRRYAALLVMVLAGSLISSFIFTNDIEAPENQIDEIQRMLDSYIPYTIKNTGCSIPGLQPFDASIKKHLQPPNVKPCASTNISLLSSNETHIWINTNNYIFFNISNKAHLSCCYKPFRVETADDIQYNDICTYFSKITKVKTGDEFVKVSCKYDTKVVYEQFYLFAIKKWAHKRISSTLSQHYNVIIIGIDYVSRMNFHRTMPKTLAFLREHDAVELMGYSTVGKDAETSSNIMIMIYGVERAQFKTKDLGSRDNVWKRFNKAGFITAHGEDSFELSSFKYDNYVSGNSIDYFLNYFMRQSAIFVGNNKGFSSNYLCMGDTFYYRVLLDYIERLTSLLRSSKLFGFFWEVTMSYDYLNYPMVMDESYVSLLNKLDSTQYLNNTVLIVLSSHGLRWGAIRGTKQGRLEERLPFAYFLMPPSFRESYSIAFRNLRVNSNRLVTAFDIYATLNDLSNLPAITDEKITARMETNYTSLKNISLFLPVSSNRTCKMAGIEKHWCTCYSETAYHTYHESIQHASTDFSQFSFDVNLITNDFRYKNDLKIAEAVSYLLTHLNVLLSGHVECAFLSLSTIENVTELAVGPADKNEVGWRDCVVTVRTNPGGAIFKATLRIPDDSLATAKLSIVDTINRLNWNPEQSSCIQDHRVKPYCVCNPYRSLRSSKP